MQDLAAGRCQPVAEDQGAALPLPLAPQRGACGNLEGRRPSRHHSIAATARSMSSTDWKVAPVRETWRWRTTPSPSITKIARIT